MNIVYFDLPSPDQRYICDVDHYQGDILQILIWTIFSNSQKHTKSKIIKKKDLIFLPEILSVAIHLDLISGLLSTEMLRMCVIMFLNI